MKVATENLKSEIDNCLRKMDIVPQTLGLF